MLKNTEKSGKPQITSENSGVRWETWIIEHAHTLSDPLVSLLFEGPDTSLRFSSVPIKGFIGLMPLPFTLYGRDKKLILHEKALSPLHHFSGRISNRGMGQLVQISRNREQVCARATFGGNQHHPQGRLRRTDGRPDRQREREGDRRARFQPPFRGGGGNNGPTVRIPSTPTHFLTSQFPERVGLKSR